MSYNIVTPLACRELTHSRPCVSYVQHACIDNATCSFTLSWTLCWNRRRVFRLDQDQDQLLCELSTTWCILVASLTRGSRSFSLKISPQSWLDVGDWLVHCDRARWTIVTGWATRLGAHRMIGLQVGRGDDVPPRRFFSTDTGHPSISLLTYCLLRHHHRRSTAI